MEAPYDPITLNDKEIRALRGEIVRMSPAERDVFIGKCDVLQFRFPVEVDDNGVARMANRPPLFRHLSKEVQEELFTPSEGRKL